MQKINEVLKSFKDELKGIMDTMLVSERMNSQRCIAKDRDTTKTIIDRKEEPKQLSQSEMNKLHKELSKLVEDLKGIGGELLISERLNTQRCIAKDVDTTKTIIDQKENENVDINEIEKLAEEAKGLVNTMVNEEKLNTETDIDKDINTTETIMDEEKNLENTEEFNKLIEELKTLMSTMLVGERLNTQRCLGKDMDTTKTIIDQKDKKIK
ncbi:Uncharacterised protein [[Clostridium] sordellii]|uniref:Uncharacterized protein n=2 Tax=Paraclostridium sordellii TaxID=1505 RepID=A0A9P1L204_PARSO|nr:hypothetical protein [Paeniclostridium sordellii]MDU5021754.1 hypothetical protein [Clostridiales bacterium]AUN14749.1 hypothetical protein RSJ16_11170 [Paeniclostridium sordellii]EPZ56818.1 hypothetical protein H476_2298 [[Clostridium] sordellii VPI 9048] [Paeniclostridium sordellii VPI 9048]MBS6024381.1 hypothetical protein [Paeniclostridium sordellii]MCH1966644.1 hypothetical protein [Paeniclostridium sordellii]